MSREWVARKYVYADGVAWNKNRLEIFVREAGQEEWRSVGGAFTQRGELTVAFLCAQREQWSINLWSDVTSHPKGRYVQGRTLHEALRMLKWKYPDPVALLNEDDRLEAMAF
jgi:hypothetical protein